MPGNTQDRIDKMFEWREQCVLRCNDVDRLIEDYGHEAFPPEFHATHAELRSTLKQYNDLCAEWINEAQGELSGVKILPEQQKKRRLPRRAIAFGLIFAMALIVVLF